MAALHGLPGQTVHVIDPVTEAAPVGVLMSFLTAFGAAVGPGPYVKADGARHCPRLFTVIAGKTARARKGTSWRAARSVIAAIDKNFADRRILGGFGSGEAVIEAVGGGRDDDDAAELESKPADVRALILEEEFVRILRVAERDGSTISPIIRQAWDDGDLSVLTRKKPVRAKGAHICVLAHITEDELTSRLRGVDLANGFANRFMFFRVERSKRIPNGRGLDDDQVAQLAHQWRQKLERARAHAGPVRRSREAEALWHDWYMSLDDNRPGMIGSLLARAEAQVLRLSLIYALADGETAIDLPHLHAALAVWSYAERSTLAIFGDAVGDPLADLILRSLREQPPGRPLTRTQIREIVGHHPPQTDVERALELLESRSLAWHERVSTSSRDGRPGRPSERWYAIFAPERTEETGEKSTLLPYLPSLPGNNATRESASRQGSAAPAEVAVDVSYRPLRGSHVTNPTSTSVVLAVGDPVPQETHTPEELPS